MRGKDKMIHKNSFSGLFIIAIVVFTIAGCSLDPIGSIGGSGNIGQDSFWVVPNRVAYNINELFQRNVDLQAFYYQKSMQSIPVEYLEISVAEDPDEAEKTVPIPVNSDYIFKNKGRKLIVVQYAGSQKQYSIEINDPLDLGGGGSGGNGNGGSGIEVDWILPW